MADLAVEVGCLDDVAVDDTDGSDAGTGDVLRRGAAQPAGSDDEYSGVDKPQLP
jgi:hypothetical protein